MEPYPNGLVPVPQRIPGTAFFPGGYGLWGVVPGQPLPAMPVGGIMVVGQDFHSEAGFRASLSAGSEVPAQGAAGPLVPTWRALLALFAEAGVPLERCFFTNYFMGLRSGAGNIGPCPGLRDQGYVGRCRSLLRMQLEEQRPRVVVTLGAVVPRLVGTMSERLSAWQKARSLPEIDVGAVGPVVRSVSVTDVDVEPCTFVALTHPSLRSVNVRRRRYGNDVGNTAEVQMIQAACSGTDLSHPR